MKYRTVKNILSLTCKNIFRKFNGMFSIFGFKNLSIPSHSQSLRLLIFIFSFSASLKVRNIYQFQTFNPTFRYLENSLQTSCTISSTSFLFASWLSKKASSHSRLIRTEPDLSLTYLKPCLNHCRIVWVSETSAYFFAVDIFSHSTINYTVRKISSGLQLRTAAHRRCSSTGNCRRPVTIRLTVDSLVLSNVAKSACVLYFSTILAFNNKFICLPPFHQKKRRRTPTLLGISPSFVNFR